ncbi:class I SAM-dependent methyltransferase [bacterium SCSIO 12741]|nr:class I SAM-dependent methyltransferase [bacterium SCSIO 12741]
MEQEWTESDLKNLAGQLARPSGEQGLKMAEVMNESNLAMTRSAMGALNLESHMSILEVGHGNAGHLKELLGLASPLEYTGLELSETMQLAASELNKELMDNHSIRFDIYDGVKLPYQRARFDRIFSVNTLYFWSNPQEFMSQLYATLKPKGSLILTWAAKAFMQQLPFVKYGFTLYEPQELEELAQSAGFLTASLDKYADKAMDKTGKPVNREYWVIRFSKS